MYVCNVYLWMLIHFFKHSILKKPELSAALVEFRPGKLAAFVYPGTLGSNLTPRSENIRKSRSGSIIVLIFIRAHWARTG